MVDLFSEKASSRDDGPASILVTPDYQLLNGWLEGTNSAPT